MLSPDHSQTLELSGDASRVARRDQVFQGELLSGPVLHLGLSQVHRAECTCKQGSEGSASQIHNYKYTHTKNEYNPNFANNFLTSENGTFEPQHTPLSVCHF